MPPLAAALLFASALLTGPHAAPAEVTRAPAATVLPGVGVTGTVIAADTGIPIPGVAVHVEGTTLHVETNAQGSFRFAAVPAASGAVTLRFSRIGFASEDRTLPLPPSGTLRIEVRMTPSAVELAPLSVLLERTRLVGDLLDALSAPGSAYQLTRKDLASTGLPFGNVHDMLRLVPGVNVQDEEGFGSRPHIGLRGAGAERSGNVTLMEDGVLIAPAPYASPAAYYFPTAGRMEGIEVRKGASQVRYGPRTLGGAVNLISAPIPDRRSLELELAGGGAAMLRAHLRAGDRTPRMGWLVQGYRMGTDGFKELEGGGDTGFDTSDLLGKLSFNSDPELPRYQEVEFRFGVTSHRADETYLGLTEADFRSRSLLRYAGSQVDRLTADHRAMRVQYFLRPTPRTDLVVTAYRHDFARNWYKLQTVMGVGLPGVTSDPETHAEAMAVLRGGESGADALRVRANNRSYLSTGIQATAGFRGALGGAHHNLELGLRFHRDEEDRHQWEDGYRMSGRRMLLTSEGVPGSQDNRLSEAAAVALFVQDEIRAGSWAWTPGVRFEWIDFIRTDWERSDPDRLGASELRTNSVAVIIPGFGAAREVNPWTHLFAGIHRGFGPPGPGAGEETRAEESVNFEAGVRVRRRVAGMNLTLYRSGYANILGRATLATGESGSGELFNGGAVEVQGVEVSMDADLGAAVGTGVRIPVRASYTLARGTFGTSFQSGYGPWGTVEAGDRIPYLPEHAHSGSLGIEDAGWALRLGWKGASAMRTEAGRGPIPQGQGADSFLVLSLSAEFSPGAGGTLHATIENLTDERYVVSRRPAGARPGLPRTLQLGYRISY